MPWCVSPCLSGISDTFEPGLIREFRSLVVRFVFFRRRRRGAVRCWACASAIGLLLSLSVVLLVQSVQFVEIHGHIRKGQRLSDHQVVSKARVGFEVHGFANGLVQRFVYSHGNHQSDQRSDQRSEEDVQSENEPVGSVVQELGMESPGKRVDFVQHAPQGPPQLVPIDHIDGRQLVIVAKFPPIAKQVVDKDRSEAKLGQLVVGLHKVLGVVRVVLLQLFPGKLAHGLRRVPDPSNGGPLSQLQKGIDVVKVAGGDKLVYFAVVLGHGRLVDPGKSAVLVHLKVAPVVVRLLAQEAQGVFRTVLEIKGLPGILHRCGVGCAPWIAPGDELRVFVRVYPGIKADRAPERQAWIGGLLVPAQLRIEAGPGPVDAKVEVRVHVNVPVPRAPQL
mmetsp:Transcript_2025/g.5396  ORF Transcript_2025/g.5396 Transcript_2025/m.5396 type:complete len:391 (-) Transcript_2025:635-1807(-)